MKAAIATESSVSTPVIDAAVASAASKLNSMVNESPTESFKKNSPANAVANSSTKPSGADADPDAEAKIDTLSPISNGANENRWPTAGDALAVPAPGFPPSC